MRLDYTTIGMLAVAITLFVADRFLPVGARLARDYPRLRLVRDNRAQGALLQDAPAIAVDDKFGANTLSLNLREPLPFPRWCS